MNELSESTLHVRRADGSIDLELLTKALDVTEGELAACIRLPGQNPQDELRRLDELVQILDRVTPWTGSPREAFRWFCHRRIAGFGPKTASDLVQAGRASAVKGYLDRFADGGYA